MGYRIRCRNRSIRWGPSIYERGAVLENWTALQHTAFIWNVPQRDVCFLCISYSIMFGTDQRELIRHKWCRKLFFRHIFFCRIYFFTKTFLFAIYDSWYFQHKLLNFHNVFCLFISQMPLFFSSYKILCLFFIDWIALFYLNTTRNRYFFFTT